MIEKKSSIKKLSIKKLKVSNSIELSNHNYTKFKVDKHGNIKNEGDIHCNGNIYANNFSTFAPTGSTGPNGPTGFIGTTGSIGDIGNTGATGPTGLNTNLSYTVSPVLSSSNPYYIFNNIEDYDIYQIDTTNNTVNINLPDISLLPSLGNLRLYKFSDYSGNFNSNNLIITASDSNTIAGSPSISLTTSSTGIQIASDGISNWVLLNMC